MNCHAFTRGSLPKRSAPFPFATLGYLHRRRYPRVTTIFKGNFVLYESSHSVLSKKEYYRTMNLESQQRPERQRPVDRSDASPQYSTLSYFRYIDDLTNTDVPGTVIENGETIPVMNRRGELFIRPTKVVVAEVFSTTWPFLGDTARPLPDLTARLTVYDIVGGEKKIDSRGHASTTASVDSIQITIHDGLVAVPTKEGKAELVEPSKGLSALEDFCDRNGLSRVDRVHPVNYEYPSD